MSISQSKLAKKYKNVADDLDRIARDGRNLGATEGPQRLELICEQYSQLSPNTAYLWIDPNAFQREIEEAQSSTPRMETAIVARNILSLLPLIATWFALFTAVDAYQKTADKSRPFLELWQTGFNGATWLTFTFAAGLDVALLILYLASILLVGEMERRARQEGVLFVRRLQVKINELLACVEKDGYTHIGDQTDIDKVVDSVKDVVDKATASFKVMVDEAMEAVKVAVNSSVQTNRNTLDTMEQSVKALNASTQASIQGVVNASTQAITTANDKVEALFTKNIIPMMTDFHTDMGTLHTELGNYQGRLNDLTTASQQLAGASQGLTQTSQALVTNADRYIAIGQDIGAQIGSLNRTQEDVLVQIQSVASGISTAAGNMTTATSNMENATRKVEGVAIQLDRGTRAAMTAMTQNIGQATDALSYVGPRLEQTATHLQQAASLLASIQRFPWPFRRRQQSQAGGQAGGANI